MMSTNLGPLTSPQGTAGKNVGHKLAKLAKKYARGGGVDKMHVVLGEFKRGKLRSGSKSGPRVTSRKQAIAIGLSEKRRQLAGKYAKGGSTGWWGQLQQEVQALTPAPQSPLQKAMGGKVRK